MATIPQFPEDFLLRVHPFHGLGSVQFLYPPTQANPITKETVTISIVGGNQSLYGNGTTTFELMDNRTDEILGWLTKEEINQYLRDNPIED